MIQIRRKESIFHADGGWFSADWHFSFGGYDDPQNTRFGALRVFNVDTLVPGAVWPLHYHENIEVITYCVDGVFEHADDRGHGGLLYPGDVQHTTVGSGIMHSEINHSKTEPMTFIQIWVLPKKPGLSPRVEQMHVERHERLNRWRPIVSNCADNALPIEQDAEAHVAALAPAARITRPIEKAHGAYLYLISGAVQVNGNVLESREAAKITEAPEVTVEAAEPSELLMLTVTCRP